MSQGDIPSERIMHEALELFMSGEFRAINPGATAEELAQDASSFAILDAITRGEKYPGIVDTAKQVEKLADQTKGNN